MSTTVAHLELLATWPSGERRPVSIRIHSPIRGSTGEWSCAGEMPGLHEDLLPMRGEDALQALCLAMGLCATLLRGHVASGGGLHYPDGGEFPLEAYFGWIGAAEPAA